MEIIGNGINCSLKTDILSKMLDPVSSPKRVRSRSESLQDRDSERLTLNIGGTRFETRAHHFANIPGSRLHGLSILKKSDISYDSKKDEYFFDRNAALFASILDLYR